MISQRVRISIDLTHQANRILVHIQKIIIISYTEGGMNTEEIVKQQNYNMI